MFIVLGDIDALPYLKEFGSWAVVVYLVRWLTQRWEAKMEDHLKLTREIASFLHDRKDLIEEHRRKIESWGMLLVGYNEDLKTLVPAIERLNTLLDTLVKRLEH